jgi:hypothetical protein
MDNLLSAVSIIGIPAYLILGCAALGLVGGVVARGEARPIGLRVAAATLPLVLMTIIAGVSCAYIAVYTSEALAGASAPDQQRLWAASLAMTLNLTCLWSAAVLLVAPAVAILIATNTSKASAEKPGPEVRLLTALGMFSTIALCVFRVIPYAAGAAVLVAAFLLGIALAEKRAARSSNDAVFAVLIVFVFVAVAVLGPVLRDLITFTQLGEVPHHQRMIFLVSESASWAGQQKATHITLVIGGAATIFLLSARQRKGEHRVVIGLLVAATLFVLGFANVTSAQRPTLLGYANHQLTACAIEASECRRDDLAACEQAGACADVVVRDRGCAAAFYRSACDGGRVESCAKLAELETTPTTPECLQLR